MNNIVEYDYLCHYGILGMKWGVRRFQNPDGTRTAAGKARYGERPPFSGAGSKAKSLVKNAKKNVPDIKKKEKHIPTDEERKAAIMKNPTYKDIKENQHLFSNEELNEMANRSNVMNRIRNDEYNAKRADIETKISNIRKVKEGLELGLTVFKTGKEVFQAASYGIKLVDALKNNNKSEALDYLLEWSSGGSNKKNKDKDKDKNKNENENEQTPSRDELERMEREMLRWSWGG